LCKLNALLSCSQQCSSTINKLFFYYGVVCCVQKCVTALDKPWHPEHFCCMMCGRLLGDDVGFHEHDGRPYCEYACLCVYCINLYVYVCLYTVHIYASSSCCLVVKALELHTAGPLPIPTVTLVSL